MEDSRKKPIDQFEGLHVRQEAQSLAVQIYQTTKQFPREEIYRISSQLRRASSSISANIAEGFGRQTTKYKLHFYIIAYGSALETKNFLYLSRKLAYIGEAELKEILRQVISVQKLLNAFMRPLK